MILVDLFKLNYGVTSCTMKKTLVEHQV